MTNDLFVVSEVSQLRALASPVRSQIMDLLRQGGEKSVSELATLIRATGPATHYQVERLVETGLVVRVGKRRVGPRSESLFRAVAKRIKIPARPESPEYMKALLALAIANLRKLESEIIEAHQAISRPQDASAVRLIERKGFVAIEDLPKLYALLEAAADLIQPEGTNSGKVRLGLHAFAVKLPVIREKSPT